MDNNNVKLSVYPLVSRISSGDAHLPLRITGPFPQQGAETITISLYHLHELLETFQFSYESEMTLNLPITDLTSTQSGIGLGIVVRLGSMYAQTAIDFAPGPIRYGFVSDFAPSDSRRQDAILQNLLENHITHVQFYDWNYRPHQFKPDEGGASVYQDTMGKTISLEVLHGLIKAIQERGIAAIGYGAVYAAVEEYVTTHSKEALLDINGGCFSLIDTFFIMNLGNISWRKRILAQYEYAIREMGFDGIHMDAYGYPKAGWGYDSEESEFPQYYELDEQFVSLINEWATQSTESIFNNVNAWPMMKTGKAYQAATYIEVWKPYTKYYHLRSLILQAKENGKPVILAAYLLSFREQEEESQIKALVCAKILTAVVTSYGATALLLGQEGAILTQPYYSDYVLLSEHAKMEIQAYQDFQVRYGELFYHASLVDITESHGVGENREFDYHIDGENISISHDGEAGSIWVVIRRTETRIVISVINLIDQKDSLWNSPKDMVVTKPSMQIQVPRYKKKMEWYATSPEWGSEAKHIETKQVEGKETSMVVYLPELPLWTTLWCELG
jgi:dextranase